MVKNGMKGIFDQGEMDMHFGDKNLTIRYPNKTQDVYDVATTGGATLILTKDNVVYNVVNNIVANLKHTEAMGLATKGADKPAPDSFKSAMASNDSLSVVMWKCNGQGKEAKCNFTQSESELAIAPEDDDKCNVY